MAAKAITFPNRACPKCGKAVHIRAKNHECGWAVESSAASPKEKPAQSESSNGKKISKMEAMRRLLAETGKDAKPLELQEQLKKKFGIEMDPSVISNYKGTILRQGPAKKMGRPKGSKTGQTAAAHSPIKANGSVSISIEDIRAVKDLAERLGADKLRQLAEVLAK